MKKLLFILTLLVVPAFSQTSNAVMRQFAGVPTGGCSFLQLALNASTGDLYDCFMGAWHIVTGGGGGGSPGGLTGQVQYNNAGSFGGITNLTSNGTNPIMKAIAAPASPSSGFGIPYEDSTSLNLAFKNAAGTVNHGVQTKAAVIHNFLNAINDAGSVSAAQPACADLSDAASGCSSAASPPTGPAGCLQDYATSTTFGCGNLFYDGSQYYIFGTNDFSGTAPALGFAANQFSVDINQSLNSQLIALTFSAGGAFGADLNSVSILVEAQADSITKYFDSQMNFGAVSGDGSTSALPYTMGAEGHCATVNSCVNGTLTDYDFFLINGVTGETLLQNTSASAHQLSVPAVTQFATLGNYVAVGPIISNDTTDSNPFFLSKNAIAEAAPGAGYGSLELRAGTTAGTCKVLVKAGTSSTPIVLIDNVGSGC